MTATVGTRYTRLFLSVSLLLTFALAIPPRALAATQGLPATDAAAWSTVHEVVPGSGATRSLAGSLDATGPVWFVDGFESGSVYTNWTVLDQYTWGASTYEAPHTGGYSAWCLGSYYNYYGEDWYPINYTARMVRGPYNLSNSSGHTSLKAALWIDSEPNNDMAKILVSTDSHNYYGYGYSGYYPTWRNTRLDLSNVGGLGDVSKSPNLYVMLAFTSGGTDYEGEGNFFDDVTLQDDGPDLIANSVSCATTAVVGSTISVSDSVYNQGASAATTFTVSYYLSSDATIDQNDILLGSRQVDSLASSASNAGISQFTVPAGLVGTCTIGAIVDSGSQVSEAREDNNVCAGNQVFVSRPIYSTSLTRSGATSAGRNHTYKLTGTIKPAAAGGRVKICWERYYSGKYRTVKTAYATLARGTYSCSYKPTVKGKWRAYVYYTGQTAATAIYSPAPTVYKAFTVK